ncbi:MAG: hypothetical protein M0Z71_00015 [Nitrospiraceae bacterium]|nr:hypothetical protein [Nitrospiraceae bacterium]
MITLILLMIPAILLSLNVAVTPPSQALYNDMAYKKALSAYYQTGAAPSTVSVMGATVSVGVVDVTDLNYQYLDQLSWKKINSEQAIISTCNQIMNKCNVSDITKVFAFLPANKGTLQSMLSLTQTKNTINCGVPSDYSAYGLYMIQQALSSQDTTQTIGDTTYALYYNKPLSGSGCFFTDIVNAQ